MEITKKVQFLLKEPVELDGTKMTRYDFTDLESGFPFSVYGSLSSYDKLENYRIYDLKFKLVYELGNKKLVWKVKGI